MFYNIRPLTYIALLFFSISSCHSDLEKKQYEEIPGLWQYKHVNDTAFSYPGCAEFFDTGTWQRHDGCTIAEGTYWFDEDTLITTILNYTNSEAYDTTKALVIQLGSGAMTTFNYFLNDTLNYKRTEKDDSSNCWSFED